MGSDGRYGYRVGHMAVASDTPLPGLPESRIVTPEWRVCLTSPTRVPRRSLEYHAWTFPGGRTWLRFRRAGERRVLVFPGIAQFVVDEQARQVSARLDAGAAACRARQALVHHVLPLLAGRRRLVLHGSAVADAGGVVAFVGDGGSGKSTLAAAMGQAGWRLVADDAVMLSEGRPLRVYPVGTSLRLLDDTISRVLHAGPSGYARLHPRSPKRHVPIDETCRLRRATAAERLRAVYLLEPAPARGGAICVDDVRPADAVRRLFQAAFEMWIDDPAHVARTFHRVTRLVTDVGVRRLGVPGRYARLDEVIAAVTRDLMAG
ncbi:MAG: hypothetical protein AB1635_03920 [Acidobacteriota bacterium]